MAEQRKHGVSNHAYQHLQEADTNGDGYVSSEELAMYLEFKRRELEDQDAQRDAMRKMTWFALWGMLLYPVTIVIASYLDVDDAAKIIGNIAPTYFVAISALVAAFFGANAYSASKKSEAAPQPPRPSFPTQAPMTYDEPAPAPVVDTTSPAPAFGEDPAPTPVAAATTRVTPTRKIV
jgi:hypothetical protein